MELVLCVVAIGLLGLALARSMQRLRGQRVSVARLISCWSPPYAPRFEAVNTERRASHDPIIRGINERRARIEAMRALDNTEFIDDLLAWRCKACLAVYVDWPQAFECHKRNSKS